MLRNSPTLLPASLYQSNTFLIPVSLFVTIAPSSARLTTEPSVVAFTFTFLAVIVPTVVFPAAVAVEPTMVLILFFSLASVAGGFVAPGALLILSRLYWAAVISSRIWYVSAVAFFMVSDTLSSALRSFNACTFSWLARSI